MYRFGTVFLGLAKSTLRNRMAMFWNIVFPIAYMGLFGYLSKGGGFGGSGGVQTGFGQGGQISYVSYLTVGVLVMQAMSVGIMGFGRNMVIWREQGVLRRMAVTPLPVWQFLLALLAVDVALILLNALLVVAMAIGLFGVRFNPGGFIVGIPVFLVTILVFLGIGQLMAALCTKTETINAVSQVVYFILLFVGGIFIPTEAFPRAVQTVLAWLPTSLSLDSLRPSLLLGAVGGDVLRTSGVLAVYFLVLFILGTRSFHWERV